MNIMHIVQGFPPKAYGGTEMVAYNLALYQVKRHNVSVFTRIEDFSKENDMIEEYNIGNIHVKGMINNFPQKNILKNQRLINRAAEKYLEQFINEKKPDIVIVEHTIGLSVNLLSIIHSKNIPILYIITDWWLICPRIQLFNKNNQLCTGPGILKCGSCFSHPFSWKRNRLTLLAFFIFRNILIKNRLKPVKRFVVGSEYIKQSYLKTGIIPAEKIDVIPFGIDTSFVESFKRKPHNSLRFGYVGTILPHKGLHILIPAFNRFKSKDVTLSLYGNDRVSPEYTNYLKSLAKHPNIKFMGPFKEGYLSEVLSNIDVLVLPSIGHESFGLVIREAHAVGIPVIIPKFGALLEAIEDGKGGLFFNIGDVDDLFSKMKSLVVEPKLLDKISSSIPRVKSFKEYGEEIDKLIETIIRE